MEAFSLDDFKEPVEKSKEELEEERKILEAKVKACKDILAKEFEEEEIKPANSLRRTIIFVGRTRSGKSTTYEVLKTPSHVPQPLSIFSDTVDPKIQIFNVTKKFKDLEEFKKFQEKSKEDIKPVVEGDGTVRINFSINIIDTPGLFERKRIGQKARDDEMLKKTILQCMEHNINSVNAIFFVCSFSTGIIEDDLRAFEEFMKLFKGAEENVALLITRSEELSDTKCRELVRQLLQESRLKPLIEKIKMRIFFMGAIPDSDVSNKLIEAVSFKIGLVEQRRMRLLDAIFHQSAHCMVDQLDLVREFESIAIVAMKDWVEKMEKALSGKYDNNLLDDLKVELDKQRVVMEENSNFIVSQEGKELKRKIVNMEWERFKFRRLFGLLNTPAGELDEGKRVELDRLSSELHRNLYLFDNEKFPKNFEAYKTYLEHEFNKSCERISQAKNVEDKMKEFAFIRRSLQNLSIDNRKKAEALYKEHFPDSK